MNIPGRFANAILFFTEAFRVTIIPYISSICSYIPLDVGSFSGRFANAILFYADAFPIIRHGYVEQ